MSSFINTLPRFKNIGILLLPRLVCWIYWTSAHQTIICTIICVTYLVFESSNCRCCHCSSERNICFHIDILLLWIEAQGLNWSWTTCTIPLVVTGTFKCPMGARTVCLWGHLTPAERAGVDGRSTARGNNTAAGYLMPINIQQKWGTLSRRLMLANFPR